MEENEIDINQIKEELINGVETSGIDVVNAKAYERMDISNGGESLQTEADLIILQEKTEGGINKYEIFDTQKNKIGEIDASGNITYDAEFEAKFKDLPIELEMNAKELIEKNAEKEVKDQKDKSEYDEKIHKELGEEKEPEGDLENEDEELLEDEEKEDRESLNDDELSEAISKDLGEDILVSNVLDAKTKVGETETLENKIGAPGRYSRFAIIQSNGQFEIVGENIETGKFESVDSLEKVDDSNYNFKIASGDGRYENATTRNLFKVKGSEQDAIAINQETDSRTFISSMNLDEESKTAYGIRIDGDPTTREYVKSAVENERDGSKSATEMAEREQKLKEETGKEADNIMDITQDGEITNSVDNYEPIKLSDGSYTTIADEAQKFGYNVDKFRSMVEDKATDSVADAIEEIREDERGFSPEPDPDREHYFPGDENNN